MDTQYRDRDRAEVERSAAEARKYQLLPAEVERYLDPPADSAYPLEYSFSLLGDIRGKTVLDFGCGTGENMLPLIARGARVIGMDISPDLIALAHKRLQDAGQKGILQVGSAYETGFEDQSVDVIFCMSLIHHLDIERVRMEMRRILRSNGIIIVKEPIRFSRTYAWLRKLFPQHGDVSEYEHPLTRDELASLTQGFTVEGMRFFRLPIVPLLKGMAPFDGAAAWKASNFIIERSRLAQRYATSVVFRLRKME